jgi:hypothetical protein
MMGRPCRRSDAPSRARMTASLRFCGADKNRKKEQGGGGARNKLGARE